MEQHTPLPVKTQAAFKLMHPEQRLAHFKFYNRVNEVQESIGDLWLSFHLMEEDVDESVVQDVLLEFEIDENNLITVAAGLKDLPEVNVSRTLSRGSVDEKLFLDLEESIGRVNSEKHEYYVVYDFLRRAIGIATEINQVIDPETGVTNDHVQQQVVRHQAVAEQLVAQEKAALPNIYYAENFIAGVGRFLNDRERRVLQQKIDKLKGESATGSVDDILRARSALLEELDKHAVLSSLNNVYRALDIVTENDPAKAPRYEKYLHDITSAMSRNDTDTFLRLLTEVMPEVSQILRDVGSKDLRIWKEIRE